MKQDDELWMKKMKEMLADYSEPAPSDGWERLQKDMLPVAGRRIYPYKWWAAAAAVLILAVSGVSFYFLNSPVADEIRMATTPTVNPVLGEIPVIPVPETKSARVEPLEPIGKKPLAIARNTVKTTVPAIQDYEPATSGLPVTGQPEPAIDNEKPTAKTEEQPEENRQAQQAEAKDDRRIARPSGKDKLHLPAENNARTSRKSGGWSTALSVNSGAGASLDSDLGGNEPQSILQNIPLYEFANSAGGNYGSLVDISPRDKVIFKDGIPYYLSSDVNYNHRQPISFGFSVRKEIANNFSVETGLTYTFLSSEITSKTQGKLGDQKLHYLGIPLRGNWNFVNSRNFTVYLTAGGMIEKCVYGKIGDKKHTVNPLQFSLMGGIGAQFNITRKVGIYAEPGVAYFFDDGSGVETIRKENPFNINLQAGIRLTY